MNDRPEMAQLPHVQEAFPEVPARYWRKIEDNRIECTLCPRLCKLKDGQRGLCFVRARREAQMVLTTYGRSSGFCIDPIEKKPLNHFLPGTSVLSFGTAGCNLGCTFCQNHDTSKARHMDAMQAFASPDEIAEAAQRYQCRSVAFTYNDPVIFLEYALDVARACHARNIKTVAVTAGYICPEPRREFFALMDAANVDLKAFSQRFYHDYVKGRLADVLDTLLYIKRETAVWLEITTLLIAGENDSNDEIEAMALWIKNELGADVPLHFTAFHPDYRMLDRGATPHSRLALARRIARRVGLQHVYVGNVHDIGRQSSHCASCGERVIGRDWHHLSSWRLTPQGKCEACGAPLNGVFEARAGTWGRKRQPVVVGRRS